MVIRDEPVCVVSDVASGGTTRGGVPGEGIATCGHTVSIAEAGTGGLRFAERKKYRKLWIVAWMVGVAQLVERRSVAPNVAGSIPVSHPKLRNSAKLR